MEVKVGDMFDPAMMEAMTEIESDLPHGAVVEEIEPGYRLHEKVLRASRVIISKGKHDSSSYARNPFLQKDPSGLDFKDKIIKSD